MGINRLLPLIFGLGSLCSYPWLTPSEAVQLRDSSTPLTIDGTVAFENAPDLVNVYTTFNDAGAWGAKYYFTLSLPEDAGEALGKIKIQQRQGMENIEFRIEDTLAFLGNPRQKGESLAVEGIEVDREERTVAINFSQPIPPGETFTIGLKPRRNPRFGGVYLFGVTTFPAAAKPYSTYIGVGRLHFYEGGYDVLP